MQAESKTDISRVKGWANKLSVFRSFVTEALLVCLFAVGVFFTIVEFRSDNVIIDVIEIPKQLSDKLSTNVAITRQLVDAAEKIAQKKYHEGTYPLALLQSTEPDNPCFNKFEEIIQKGKKELKKCNEARPPTTDTAGLFSLSNSVGIEPLMRLDSEEPDIEVPAFGSLRSTIRVLKEAMGIRETHITGEITQIGEDMRLVLRSNDPNAVQPEPIPKTSDTQELIANGGKALIQLHSPCVAASYYYREELDGKKFSATTRLVEPCRKNSEYFADLILGLVAYEDNDYSKAIKHFQRAIYKDSKSPDAYFHLGRALQKNDQPYQAKAAYENAINADQNFVDAYVGLASLLADADRPEEAVKALQDIKGLIDRNPQRVADIYVSWGNALLNMNMPGDAGSKYEQAVSIQKDHVVAHNNWGVTLYSEGEYSAAMDKYKETIGFDNRYRDAFINYGMAMIELRPEKNKEDRFREAIGLYRDAIERDPKFTMAYFFSAIANLRLAILESEVDKSQADARAAEKDFLRFEEFMDTESREKSADLFNHWGNALLVLAKQRSVDSKRAKKYRKAAIQAYENAIKATKEPEDYYYPYFNQSIAYFLLDNKTKSVELYRTGVKARDQYYERARSKEQKSDFASLEIKGSGEDRAGRAAMTFQEKEDFSFDRQAESSQPIVPERLIWPLTGGFAVFLTGLLIITVKNLRKAKTVETLKSGAAETPPPSPPSRPDVSTETSVLRRRTEVEGNFPTPGRLRPTAILRCVAGAMQNRQFPIEKESISIGANSENDLCIADDDYVSGNHAFLRRENGGLFVLDQGSRNGTFLNGERLSDTARALKAGDRIQIGRTTFEVLL